MDSDESRVAPFDPSTGSGSPRAESRGDSRSLAQGKQARKAPPLHPWRFVEPLLWIGLYIALAEWLGFLLTAGTLLLVYLLRLGTRLRVALPIAIVLVPITYYVFAGLLRVALPRGILGW